MVPVFFFSWLSLPLAFVLFVWPAPAPACAPFGSAKGGASGAGFAYQIKIQLLLLAAAGFAANNLSKIWPCEPTYFHFRCHRGRLSRLFISQSRRCLHRFMFRRSGINYLGCLTAAQLTLQSIFVSTFLRFHGFGLNSFMPLKVIAFSDFQSRASFCTELIGNASHWFAPATSPLLALCCLSAASARKLAPAAQAQNVCCAAGACRQLARLPAGCQLEIVRASEALPNVAKQRSASYGYFICKKLGY